MEIDFDEELARVAVVTADVSHEQIDRSVREVLRLVREHLQMDVAFVSHFTQGQRVLQYVDEDGDRQLLDEGRAGPLEQSFCQRVIDGRLPELVRDVRKLPDFDKLPITPFRIGAHLSTPIVLEDGSVYGTFCCFSLAPNDSLVERDLKRLRMAARMAARLIDQARKLD